MSAIPHYHVYRLFCMGNYHYQIIEFVDGAPDNSLDLPNTDFETACQALNELGTVTHTRH